MCGRFVLLTDLSVVSEAFDIQHSASEYKQGNNISPGQQITAAVRRDNRNILVNFRWGLIPSWAKDPSIGNKMFNARAETVAEKPSFRNAFYKRRCLIIADGFYEWQRQEKIKTPYCFRLKSGQPFGFAGLYESWISPENQQINTCTIITTRANELIKPIHDRMPVILEKEEERLWIDPNTHNRDILLSVLKPYVSQDLDVSEAGALLKD